jgi:hypothetical protein
MKVSKFRNFMMVASTVLCSVLIVSCDKDDNDDNFNDRNYTVSGSAAGNQVVPAAGGTGNGTMSGTYNSANNTLTYNTSWAGLSGAPNSGNFYKGTAGMNGATAGTAWTFPSGTTATGTRSGTMTLTDAQEADFLSGQWYYSYGTTANPGGEVRGQMTAIPQ